MTDKTFSVRPCPTVVALFDAIPNKVPEWREKWLCIESSTEFPFPLLVWSLEAWKPVGKNPHYSEYYRRFLDFVKSELGDDPKTQTKVFSINDLLKGESRKWCVMASPNNEGHCNLLGLIDTDEYLA